MNGEKDCLSSHCRFLPSAQDDGLISPCKVNAHPGTYVSAIERREVIELEIQL